MPSFLARRCTGARRTTIYQLSEAQIPRGWRFLPTGVNANGEQTGGQHALLRQGGVAAVAHSPAAALTLLESVS